MPLDEDMTEPPQEDDNVLRFVVPGLSTMGRKGVLSPPRTIGQYQWWVHLRPARVDPTIWHLSLACDTKGRLWEVVCQPKWRVYDQETGEPYTNAASEEVDIVFCHDAPKVQLCLIRARKMPPGCIKNNMMQLYVEIGIKDPAADYDRAAEEEEEEEIVRSNVHKLCISDFFSPSVEFNVALKLSDGMVYASKQYLALHSAYFHSLFFGPFRETNQDVIEIADVKTTIFHSVLCMLHRIKGGCLTRTNLEEHLEIADRFQLEVITADCAAFLAKNMKSISRINRVMIADQYRLHDLLMSSIDGLEMLDIWKMSDSGDRARLSRDGSSRFAARFCALSRRPAPDADSPPPELLLL